VPNICSLALLPPGTHRLGPGNATLAVRTKRGGAAAKAGHDLDMLVTAWEGTLEVGEDGAATAAQLTADATSLRVQKGTGGMQALGEDDKANIHQTIDDEVLKRQDIAFRSARVESAGEGLHVEGELTLAGTTKPLSFDLAVSADGVLAASVTVTQTSFGMKPYSALWGALKVLDEVEVVLDGKVDS
jgi:polyisoprenoid-binding protein YceI